MDENQKYQAILKAARQLFIKHGTRRITIEEICQTAGVSKMTLYKFFKNKQDIACKVLDQFVAEGYRKYDEIMSRPVSFREKMEQVLEMKISASRELGSEFINDYLGGDEALREYFLQKQREGVELALKLLEQGKREGVIRADLHPEFYIYTMNEVYRMLGEERLKAIFPDSRQRISELVKFWFYGMFDAIG